MIYLAFETRGERGRMKHRRTSHTAIIQFSSELSSQSIGSGIIGNPQNETQSSQKTTCLEGKWDRSQYWKHGKVLENMIDFYRWDLLPSRHNFYFLLLLVLYFLQVFLIFLTSQVAIHYNLLSDRPRPLSTFFTNLLLIREIITFFFPLKTILMTNSLFLIFMRYKNA